MSNRQLAKQRGAAVPAEEAYRTVLRRQTISRAIRMRHVYLLMLLAFALLIIFKYLPIYGLVIAFKDYNFYDGLLGSPWNDFAHFKRLFKDPFFLRVFFNTFWLSVLRLVFGFPFPIILVLLLTEVRISWFKRTVQTISYLPHFISWVILAGILTEILSPQRGIIAHLYTLVGLEPVHWLTNKATFRGLLVSTGVWQSMGWTSIIYLAALSGVDPGLYETASIDGANRWHKARHISLPSLVPVMTILFLIQVGRILDESFAQIFNLYNPLVYAVADIFETYIYRVGIEHAQFDYSAAVGLFKNVAGVIILVVANSLIKRYSEYAIW
jgi:putative aldouronate transport system permease protein